ncbi:PREDICTED: nuclear pore-associated protein 1-like [Bison bison bison]|uniref:Nuclear pore-associated protein 1-like n=1 Tax=Bison bison bison TaxID=43346 RepID=A0A6P3I4S8_BISBB|nr:PREDICTED: nuclear pore-associated protein 1-like [Bison bison bison]
MGNLLCKFVSALRRRNPLGRRSLVLPSRDAITSGRGHPAAPAPALHPGHRLLNQDRLPLSSSFYIAPKRQYPIQQAGYSPVGVLPVTNLRNSPKKQPVLSTRNSMMFGPSRTVRIPPPGRKITLLRSLTELPARVVKVGNPVPTRHLPLRCTKESEAMVQEEPRESITKEEGHTEAEGENNGKISLYCDRDITMTPRPQEPSGVLTSLQCSPEPPNLPPVHPESNFNEKAQVSWKNSSSESLAICLDDTAGDGQPPSQPGPLARVLSASSPCCNLLPERPIEEVLGEDHRPSSPESLMSGKALQREQPSDTPRSSSALGSARSRHPLKRKRPLPVFLPLPPLLPPLPPPLPLPWGRSDLPLPPKLPGMTLAKTWGTLKQRMERQRNKILKDVRKAMRRCSAPPPAPGTTGSLAPVSHILEVPPTTTHLAELSSRFPSLAGLPPYTDQEARYTAPASSHSAIPADYLFPPVWNPIVGITLKEDEGTRCSVKATPPFTSDLSTPLSTPTLSFQPPSYKNESPTPMCVDSPPPLNLLTPLPDPPVPPPVLTEQPITSTAIPSTTTVMASTSVPSPSDSGITDMDTTPPSQAVIFQSPPGIGVEQTHTAERLGTTIQFVPMVSRHASIFNYPFDSRNNPQPTFATTDEQKRASVLPSPPSGAPAADFPRPPFGTPAAIFPRPAPGNQAAVFPGPLPENQAAIFPGPPPKTPAAVFPGPLPGNQAAVFPGPPPKTPAAVFPGPLPENQAAVFPGPPPRTLAAVFPGPPPGNQAAVFPGLRPGDQAAVFPWPPPRTLAAIFPGPPPGNQAAVFPWPPPRTLAAVFPGPPPGNQAAVFPGPPPRTSAAVFPGPLPGNQAAVFPGPPPKTPAAVFPGPAPVIYAPADGISTDVKPVFDIDAMHTTPPPQTVIFQSTSDSKENHYPYHMAILGSENTAPSGGNAWTQASTYLPVDLVNRVQPPRGSKMDSGLPDPLSAITTINMQPAFVYNSGIFPRDVFATAGFGVDTTVPSTGDSSLLSASTISGPLLMGPAASMAGGSFGILCNDERALLENNSAHLSETVNLLSSYNEPKDHTRSHVQECVLYVHGCNLWNPPLSSPRPLEPANISFELNLLLFNHELPDLSELFHRCGDYRSPPVQHACAGTYLFLRFHFNHNNVALHQLGPLLFSPIGPGEAKNA